MGRAAGWRRWDLLTAAGPSKAGREPEPEREPDPSGRRARAGGAGRRGAIEPETGLWVGPGEGSSRARPVRRPGPPARRGRGPGGPEPELGLFGGSVLWASCRPMGRVVVGGLWGD